MTLSKKGKEGTDLCLQEVRYGMPYDANGTINRFLTFIGTKKSPKEFIILSGKYMLLQNKRKS